MEDDSKVRIIVELISAQASDSEDKIARIPSKYFLTDEFLNKMTKIVESKELVVIGRWILLLDAVYKEMFSSHERYLTFIMYACIREKNIYKNIFDGFINVCILVNFLNYETRVKTGVNFSHLNPDILMTFYEMELKVDFCKCGGFQGFIEYILNLKKKYNTASINKELRRVKKIIIIPDEVVNDERLINLANLVLSIPSVQVPILPSYTDLITRLVAYRREGPKKMAEGKTETEAVHKFDALNVASHGCSSSNSISKTSNDVKDLVSIEWYEKIIQAVIRHNHSKNPGNYNAKSRIQEEADGVLEHLKDKIKSLIGVLNEFDKE